MWILLLFSVMVGMVTIQNPSLTAVIACIAAVVSLDASAAAASVRTKYGEKTIMASLLFCAQSDHARFTWFV